MTRNDIPCISSLLQQFLNHTQVHVKTLGYFQSSSLTPIVRSKNAFAKIE